MDYSYSSLYMLEALWIRYVPICTDLLIYPPITYIVALGCVMSFLLLKAPDCDPRKEVISATPQAVIGQEIFKEVDGGGSFWSILGQTCEPLCTFHGDRREGPSVVKGYTAGSKALQAGIFEFDNEQQQAKKELESGQARTEPSCREEQQMCEECLKDGLLCKLVSQFCFNPDSSTACPHELEREFKELSLKDTELDASVPYLEGDNLKHVLPPASLEDLSGHVGRNGEVAALNIENNVVPIKLKSALRGGYEKAGLGPRPKVHVTWAPCVYDPPCTSTSHTTSQNHRRHHYPRSEHKNRHKGKGSNHSDSHKKSQKKMARKSKHAGGTFLSGPTIVSQREILNSTVMLKGYIAPSLDDLTFKSAKVSPFILPPKGSFLNPVLSFGERGLVTVEKTQGYRPLRVQTHKLCL